jgi:hypothetical protein
MQANHMKHVEQVEHDSMSLILAYKNWNSFKLMNQREWDKGCTYHHTEEYEKQGRPAVVQLTHAVAGSL